MINALFLIFSSQSTDLKIAKAKYIIESSQNYNEALIILNQILLQENNIKKKHEIYFYILKCHLFQNQIDKANAVYNILKVNNTIWSKKGLELFNLYNQNEADDSQSISKHITDIDQKILEDIVNNGGNLKELLVLQKKILQQKII